jgi:uncharacterized repeat protein (TIGR01451 family)
MMIVAMFGFAGLVYADGANNHGPKNAAVPKMVSDDPANPGDEVPPGPAAVSAVPANDTCAGAIELFLGISQKVNSVDANDDYQTPATYACYPDLPNGAGQHTQIPTTAPGRDVVFKFTAPAAGKYSVRLVVDGVTNDFRNQNGVLYLVDGPGCFAPGVVNCLKGANREASRVFVSSVGAANNHGEEVNCVALSAGQTVYPVFDDAKAGNAGSNPKIEVIPCVEESEPNDTIAQANDYQCEIIGATHVPVDAHCHLGTKDGQICRQSRALDVSFVGETDLDCDPRCIGGPNNGLTCARTTPAIANSNTFCNPVVDVGAYCAGLCITDRVCVGGPTPGAPCTATCDGGPRAGQFCNAAPASTSLTQNTGCGTGFACIANLSCGNGTIQNPGPGVCSTRFNEGDHDFYSLGNLAAGDRVYSAIDANTGNDYDWRMRINDSTDTLGFDDDDGNFVSGDGAPVLAGVPATGGPTYIQVSKSSPRVSEPYHLNAIVRPPLASAQLESEFNANGINNTIYYYWPSNTVAAQEINAGGYIRGNFTNNDADCWKFCVNKGDLMHWYGDGNPARTFPPTLAQLPQPIPYDSDGAGISNFVFGADARRNDLPTAPSAGLNGVTPGVTASYETYRATYTGEIEVCMYEDDRVTPAPIPAYAPGAWAGSLGVNCGPVDDCVTVPADLEVHKTISPGPYKDGDVIEYTISIVNHGPGIAADVHLQDFLDPNTIFLSLDIDDGFDKDGDGVDGDNTACFLLPTPGQNDAFLDCIGASIAPGESETYHLKVQVNSCVGPLDVFNAVTVDSRTPDPNATTCDVLNIFTGGIDTLQCETDAVSFSTTDDGSCQDIICDDVSCTANLCTEGDSCDANGACQPGGVPSCDDNSVCTEDSCDPATGCVNDSSQLGDLCDNAGANQCLEDYCDPVTFCQVRDVNCDDGNACTDDSCDPASGCQHTAHSCEDNNPCTDDSCDPASGCAHAPHVCDDGNACTSDSCDPASGCTTAPVNCDDGNACTDDSCDSATGCTHAHSSACFAQITHTGTTCSDFTSGNAGNLTDARYTTKGTAINAATPGVMFYYSTIVAPSSSFSIVVNQAIAPDSACSFPNWPPLAPQNLGQANLYSAGCGNRSSSNSYNPTTGALTMSVTGATPGEVLVVGIKYNISALKGTNVCRPHPIETYTFTDSGGNSDTLRFVPKN